MISLFDIFENPKKLRYLQVIVGIFSIFQKIYAITAV